jgi:hypothetical protein
VALRNTHLDATLSPFLQFGAFRFGPGYGELAIGYRFLATEGGEIFHLFDGLGPVQLRSRLNLQTISLDYLCRDCPLGYDTLLSWDAGARLQVIFFDTRLETAAAAQHASNYFFGAGPRGGVTLTRDLSGGLSLFGRVETALVVGYNTVQKFSLLIQNPAGPLFGTASQQRTDLSPSFAVQLGLTFTPAWLSNGRLKGGYQFEQWYSLGRVGGSVGDLETHGFFARCELDF